MYPALIAALDGYVLQCGEAIRHHFNAMVNDIILNEVDDDNIVGGDDHRQDQDEVAATRRPPLEIIDDFIGVTLHRCLILPDDSNKWND